MSTPEFWEYWDNARFDDGNGDSSPRLYGVERSHGWSGTSLPPVDWYFKSLIDDLEAELEQLIALEVYSNAELRTQCARLVAVFNKALGQ
jgi:hypothetical protein